jgi:predicted transcriptional regulator
MPREEDCIISLPTYRQHWIHTRSYGHDIVIWSDTGKVTIQCKWPDMERSNNNRVKRILEEPMPNYNKVKEKSFIKKIIKCKKAM